MACASANGHFCPPMIIYPGQRFRYEPLEGVQEAHMGRSESGWMDSELFCHWLLTCFIPAIDSRSVKRPVLLFIDGHSTHISLEASNICIANGIELYCLLEHSSHIMQPLDLRLFATLKQHWKEAVRSFQVENAGSFVTKRNFAGVFKSAWEKSTSIEIAMKGFMEAGLFPINPDCVTKSIKLEPSKVFQSSTEIPKLQQVIASDKQQQKSDQASSFNVTDSTDKSQIKESVDTQQPSLPDKQVEVLVVNNHSVSETAQSQTSCTEATSTP
ncbi:uncharacterized protein LOC132737668 [Ruditapes philippinarum]|uniref:uncharacterized protein LOC132737668 n=1 Tax=Ruditapes philippinarum TaxID=129788 RepID=UPI00295BCA71|nr:uncharacterized protein LOC132737668 [Ruditapes philippinarum]